ncbi:MAG: hypothetical protein M1826_001773 [Phylliscum demangeonii]|nr:MAG: hypothetical protein M1826_001773 [Phylliscum demangeonii]
MSRKWQPGMFYAPLHTSTLVWTSPFQQEYESYQRHMTFLQTLAPQSSAVPQTFEEWLAHRIEYLDGEIERLLKLIDLKIEALYARTPAIGPCRLAHIRDGRSAILAEPSIWSTDPAAGGWPGTPWPTAMELKFEGDDRANSSYARFLPLPRAPTNQTVVWHRSPLTLFHPLDRVRLLPTREDIEWAAVANDDMSSDLALSDLWAAIDTV